MTTHTTSGALHSIVGTANPTDQAFTVLRVGFTVAPIIAGLDKFFNLLANWEQYLAPVVADILPFSAGAFMIIVGVIEIVAGIGVWIKPRFFANVVAAWLVGIILNLLLAGAYFDVALRDLGLALGAFALGRLALSHEPGAKHTSVR